MLASIDKQRNIEIFLDAEEVGRLLRDIMRGVIINLQNPKDQRAISLSFNNTLSEVYRGYRVGVYTGHGDYTIFLADLYYKTLQTEEPFEIKYSAMGNTVRFVNITTADATEQMRATELEALIKATKVKAK